jgi:glycerate kinase
MSFRIVILSSNITKCFSAQQVDDCLARGITRVLPTAELLRIPLATYRGAAPFSPRAPLAPTVEVLLHQANLVFAVEGRDERGMPSDQVVAAVTQKAKSLHLPVIAFVATVTAEAEVALTCGIGSGAILPQAPGALSAPLSATALLLEDCVAQIMRLIVVGRELTRREERLVSPAWQTALAARVNALRKPVLR